MTKPPPTASVTRSIRAVQSLDPMVIRVYKDDRKGATAFFRNRFFLKTVLAALRELAKDPVEVFFHACSVGAEPYSFTIKAKEEGVTVRVDATDIEPNFVALAQKGLYPAGIVERMKDAEKKLFHIKGNTAVLDDSIRQKVTFLPAQSVMDPLPKTYDAVFAMNVLTYLTPAQQTQAIATMAASCRSYLCLTAFHPDTIKADIEAAGFEPVLTDQEVIHNFWGDRIREKAAEPGAEDYAWKVPPYNTDAPDYAWRYCAIFKRKTPL